MDQATLEWRGRPFYHEEVVLGLDIGLHGIGVCVRKGQEILYAKSWMVNLPGAKALADRRAKRAWRHCRANRKVRMARLKVLFQNHGLPWFEDEDPALLRSDPFLLRHRALTTGLASKHALALAIRHVVLHRGYDYRYFSDEGAYPWGNATEFKEVKKELSSLFVEEADLDQLNGLVQDFGWRDNEIEEFAEILRSRVVGENDLANHLAAHASMKRTHLRQRAKGKAYPRNLLRRHLELIIQRHQSLIENPEEFSRALFVHPRENKGEAIFYYHRKSPAEMKQHFEGKVNTCRYARWLGLEGELKCALRGDLRVQRYLLLEFLSNRRIEISNTGRSRVYLPEEAINALLNTQEQWDSASSGKTEKPSWAETKRGLEQSVLDHFGVRPATVRSSEWNKDFWTCLQDLVALRPANRNKRASISAEAASEIVARISSKGFSAESLRAELMALEVCGQSYYNFKRSVAGDAFGIYPQVDFLLGRRAKQTRKATAKHPNRLKEGGLVSEGKLRWLFKQLQPSLGGKTVPDRCVIEVIRDAPKTSAQAKEIADEIKKRAEQRNALFESHGLSDQGSRSVRLRLKLWEQQAGISPYSGISLGADPLSSHLQIEHIYPQSRGGLWVEDNLVLTTEAENQLKGDRTPHEAATDLCGSWAAMLEHSRAMRWGAKKWEIFKWEEGAVPEFGVTTRTAQLARQLTAEMARWMGIENIEDAQERENQRALRIGTPSGTLTATARAAWGMPRKDRSDLAHHLVDAVTLSYIPPREGLNSIRCGGIFFTQIREVSGKGRLSVLPLGPVPELIESMVAADADECPVVHFRPSSSRRSMHDQTLLKVLADGKLVSREPLSKETFEGDAPALSAALVESGIPPELLPSHAEIERWQHDQSGQPLRLKNGSPITRLRKVNKKATFDPPLGLVSSGIKDEAWAGVKVINESKYVGATLFRRWCEGRRGRQGSWKFFIQRVPDRQAMRSLLRMGFRWLTRKLSLPDNQISSTPSLQRIKHHMNRVEETKRHWSYLTRNEVARGALADLMALGFLAPQVWSKVHDSIWGHQLEQGDLPVMDPKTGKPSFIQKGELFRLKVTDTGRRPLEGEVYFNRWYRVAAIKSDGCIQLNPNQNTEAPNLTLRASELASHFGSFPSDDPPSHPPAR